MTDTTLNARVTEHAIDPQFAARWSPRAFTGEAIDTATLLSFFEAARWAPSAFNSQPWRFLYARRDTPQWERFVSLLSEFNLGWAQHASALVIVLSRTTITGSKGEERAAPSHIFDSGAAWAYLALQANLSGWHTHGMGGFDKVKAREMLGIPEGFEVQIAVAIGKLGDKTSLPEGLREREAPSPRKPLSELVAEGDFNLR